MEGGQLIMQRALRLEFEELGKVIDKRASQGKVNVAGVKKGVGWGFEMWSKCFQKTCVLGEYHTDKFIQQKPGQRENSKLMSM